MKKSLKLALVATLLSGGISYVNAAAPQTLAEARDRMIAAKATFKDQGVMAADQENGPGRSVGRSKHRDVQWAVKDSMGDTDDREGEMICVQVRDGRSTYIVNQIDPKKVGHDAKAGAHIWYDGIGKNMAEAIEVRLMEEERSGNKDGLIEVAGVDITPGVMDRRERVASEEDVLWVVGRVEWPGVDGWAYCATKVREFAGDDNSDVERNTPPDRPNGVVVGHHRHGHKHHHAHHHHKKHHVAPKPTIVEDKEPAVEKAEAAAAA